MLSKMIDTNNPDHLVCIVFVVIAFVILSSLNLIGTLCFVVFGICFPIIQSYSAIKTKNIDKMEITISYWICLACVTIIESIFSFVHKIIPFYTLIKTIICVWALYSNGSLSIYKLYIVPIVEQYDATRVNNFLVILMTKLSEAYIETSVVKYENTSTQTN